MGLRKEPLANCHTYGMSGLAVDEEICCKCRKIMVLEKTIDGAEVEQMILEGKT